MGYFPSHLRLLTYLTISNVWIFEASSGMRFLVDTGHWIERRILLLNLWRYGIRRKGDLQGIILTHRHSDHAGNAAYIRQKFDCPIYCHEKDAPILAGQQIPEPMIRQGMNPIFKFICAFEDRWPSQFKVDDVFSEGQWKFGLTMIPTPGHTEGASMFFHESTKTLFTGDSISASIPPFRFFEYPYLALWSFSIDYKKCLLD